MEPEAWLLTARERGNPATRLDAGHPDGAAWSAGNLVRPLIHGAVYFAELVACMREMRDDDLLLLTEAARRPGGSHHQKFVVLRHRGRPELDVAFAGAP